MNIDDIVHCHVCHGGNFRLIKDAPIEDMFTEEVEKIDSLLCVDCDTMHYIKDGALNYEFSVKIGAYNSILKTNE